MVAEGCSIDYSTGDGVESALVPTGQAGMVGDQECVTSLAFELRSRSNVALSVGHQPARQGIRHR